MFLVVVFLGMVKLTMEEKKYSWIKILGILGATTLIIFGSIDNIYRTAKLAWHKVIKD
jgi:hypothetical protein